MSLARRRRIILSAVLGVFVLLLAGVAVLVTQSEHFRIPLPVEYKEYFERHGMTGFPSALHVEGNRLATSRGDAVRLRGLMPADPYELEGEDHLERVFLKDIASSGANVVRIPVHLHSWTENPDYLWRYLDPIVGWAGELGLYAIIDWHSIGNVETGEAPLLPELYSHTAPLGCSLLAIGGSWGGW